MNPKKHQKYSHVMLHEHTHTHTVGLLETCQAYRKLTANRIKRLQAEPETGECCS